MTPQELKYSILQLAFQGKLVKQDKTDISFTATNIKVKETDEYEFDIPDGWIIAHLESVTESIATKQYQILDSEVHNEGRYPVISQSKEYSIGYCNNDEKVYRHNSPVVVFGDHTCEVKLVSFDFVVGADGVKVFSPNTNILVPSFLFYVLLYHTKELNKIGGYSRHYKYLKNKPIPIPPLAEQRRIVKKIESLLPLIDRYEKAWTRLEEFNKRFPGDMQKSLLQMAIQGKLVEQRPEEGTGEELYRQIQQEKARLVRDGRIKKEKPLPEIAEDEVPFEVPETWKWVRLGEILTSTDAGKSPQCEDRPRSGDEWGVIKTTAIQNGFFLSDENKVLPAKFVVQDNQIVHSGDLLITRAGPRNRTGVLCVVSDEPINLILSDKTVRLSYLRGFIDPLFIMYMLNSPAGQVSIVEAMTGMAASQVNISQDSMKKFLLPLPPLPEQRRIVARLEELLPLCERLK